LEAGVPAVTLPVARFSIENVFYIYKNVFCVYHVFSIHTGGQVLYRMCSIHYRMCSLYIPVARQTFSKATALQRFSNTLATH
jgi:hypothetical protein